jgi:chitinase
MLLLACMTGLALPAPVAFGAILYGSEHRERIERVRVEDANKPWLLSYYVGYHHDLMKPRDIDYSLMTHIAVGGVGVNVDGTLREHWHMPEGGGRVMALEVGRRAERAGVKRLIWLGGPNEEDRFLSASSDRYRAQFVRNVVRLVRELGYDGVDVNWEPIRPKDEENIFALVRDLRIAAPDMLISVPVNWVPTTIVTRKNLSLYPRLARYADRLFIMSYSMAGPWPGWQSWHGGALMGDTFTTPGSVRTSVRAYERAGVPTEKLGIGIGTYATCWQYPVVRPRQVVPSGFTPSQIRVMNMRTLAQEYYDRRYERWDPVAQAPYLSFQTPQGAQKCGFISFENDKSIQAKMELVRDRGLGGALVWNIGTGYFPGGVRGREHSLLGSAYGAL